MNLYELIVDYFFNILTKFKDAFGVYFDTNFLDIVIPGLNISVGALIVQLISVALFVLLFVFAYKVFKRIFYLFLGFFR